MPFPQLVCAALIIADGKILLARRRMDDHMGGRWEFPGGKLDPGESPDIALVRELQEELGITVHVEKPFTFSHWEYPEKRVLILFFLCRILRGEPRPLECDAVEWFAPSELERLDLPPADEAVLEDVLEFIPTVSSD